jgi:PAS domain S-box-containing protein
MVVCISGICCAAAVIFAPTQAYMSSVLAGLLPPAARFLYDGGEVGLTMGIVTLLFAVVLVLTGRMIHRVNADSLRLRFEKIDLIGSLTEEKARAEDLNDSLRAGLAERNRAEKAVRDSEQRYRDLAELLPQIVYETDLDGKFTFMNRSGLEATGHGPESIAAGLSATDIIAAVDHARIRVDNNMVVVGETLGAREYTAERRDGKRFPVVIHSNPIRRDGNTVGIRGVCVDVTDLKVTEEALRRARDELELRVQERTSELWQANEKLVQEVEERERIAEALRESEAKHRLVVDNALEGIVVLSEGELRFVNPRGKELLGYAAEDEVTGPISNYIHPQDVARVTEDRNEESERVEYPSDLQFRLIDGAGKEKWVQVCSAPIEWEGTPSLLAFVADVTQRRQAEDALRNSEEKFRALFEESRDAIVIVSVGGDLQDSNQAFVNMIDGGDREVVVGRNLQDYFRDGSEWSQVAEVLQKKDSANELEVTLINWGGEEIDALLSMTRRLDEYGNVIGYQGIIRDTTERNKMDRQLRHAQKMEAMGTLAGGIAHDFNNLLYVITGFASMTLDDVPKGSEAHFAITQVLNAGERATNLVKQMLTFSRRSEQRKELVRMYPIVEESLNFLRASIPATVEIRESIAPDLGIVMADATQIHQIIMNLCANSAHAMQETGGSLEVGLTNVWLDTGFTAAHPGLEQGPYVRLTVSDSGHGMTPEILERIFEPYFTTKDGGEGTGLGLAVIHGIVEDHGGAIVAESEPGKGTTFQLYLPIVQSDLEIDLDTDDESVPRGDERILVVDDEPAVAEMLKRLLTRLGYQVEARTSPREALELFRWDPSRFDLVITDMTMPQLTGKELAREVMKLRPDVPVVLCSGYNDLMDKERAEDMGIAAYVTKWIHPGAMARAIRHALGETSERASEYRDPVPGGTAGPRTEETEEERRTGDAEEISRKTEYDPTRGFNVLVIDDSAIIGLMLKDELSRKGFHVFEALSGMEALEIFTATEIDVVICDLKMPEMTGRQLGKEILAIDRKSGAAKTPFILMTGWMDGSLDEDELAESGVDKVVIKPIDTEKLIGDILELLASRPGKCE